MAALPSCASKGAANTLNVSEGGTKFFHSSAFRNKKRLSNEERLKFNLDDKLKQILIGNILGDVYMRKYSEKANARFIFRQGSPAVHALLRAKPTLLPDCAAAQKCGGVKLHTNAFKTEELNLLVEALNKNFSLKATIHKTSIQNQYTLYISKNQLPLLIKLVKEHMHPSMLYKLNI